MDRLAKSRALARVLYDTFAILLANKYEQSIVEKEGDTCIYLIKEISKELQNMEREPSLCDTCKKDCKQTICAVVRCKNYEEIGNKIRG